MRHRLATFAACALVLSSSGVLGAGLLDAYQAARENDRTFRAARYERDAGKYSEDIGRAGLLPTISISGSYAKNMGDRESTTVGATQSLDYYDRQAAITLRQPLFNYESYVRYQQGAVQSAYSDAVFDRKEAELAVKVLVGYLDALFAMDRLSLADAEIAAYDAQRELAVQRHKNGEGTITDIADAEARLQLARAGQADSLDRVTVTISTLEGMTGKPMRPLWVLRPDYVPTGIPIGSLDAWSAMAQEHNPEIRARRNALEMASLEVNRNHAGHLPQLDLVVRSARMENDTISTLNQKSSITTVGVQLNIPLFAGGRVSALTGQAVANRGRALAELEAAVTAVLIDLKRQLLAVETGASKVVAYQKAVEASLVAVEGAKEGMAAGVRTNTEVLDAVRMKFVAQRDLFQARYEVLASNLQLKALAGALSEKDIAEIGVLFRPPL